MIDHWYITVAAVHDFQRICGLPEASDGKLFDEPAAVLSKICEEAVLKKDIVPPHTSQEWQAKMLLRGKTLRLELYVRPAPREEGDAPQLVRVRSKGGNTHGRKWRESRA